MKIRMTMMLLTMSYFGLPSLNGQEIRLRSYNRETSSDYGCVVPGGQYLTWVRANNHAEDWLWVDPWDNGAMYYGMWDDACHNGLTHNNSGERFQIWPCCQNLLTGDGHEQGWQWNTDVYSEWDREILPFGYHWQVPWEHCVYTNITVSEPHNPSGIVTTNIYRYDGRTRIELLTGGPTNSTREALFLLSVSAAAGNNAIPPAQLSALGKPAMPEGGTNPVYGVIYKKLQDNQIVDATVSAPGDCYTFSASAYKSYLVLEDAAIGDVTDKTNVVWVGERIALTCSLDNWIAEITNFSWTVPGIRIGNWRVGNVVHSDNTVTPNGYARTTPLTNLNASAVTFYWVKDTANAVVQCTVQVGGETLTAKTTYEVRRPDSTWTLDPQGAPVAVTNICEPAPGFAGYWHLTTGRYGTNLGLPGMYYTYQMTDLKGYTNQWSASFVQTVWISWQGNMITEPATSWNLLCPSPSMQSTGSVAGLDTAFPYRLFGQAVSGSSHDTPRSALKTFESWVWRKDKFWSYLMWQPTRRPGSISVPLKLQSWTWQGSTGKTNDTTWPWRRTGWLNQTGGNGFDEYVHPTWETNVADSFDFRMTNNYHYPTMW